MDNNKLGRRTFLLGGVVTAVLGLVESGRRHLGLSRKSSVRENDSRDLSVVFLNESRDAENYVKQIGVMRAEVIQNLKESRPDKSAQIEAELSEDFWNQYHRDLVTGFHTDIKNNLTDEDLEKALEFFRSPAGQNYLRWKSLVQSRESTGYKAVAQMHHHMGRVMRVILDKEKDYKWKLS